MACFNRTVTSKDWLQKLHLLIYKISYFYDSSTIPSEEVIFFQITILQEVIPALIFYPINLKLRYRKKMKFLKFVF